MSYAQHRQCATCIIRDEWSLCQNFHFFHSRPGNGLVLLVECTNEFWITEETVFWFCFNRLFACALFSDDVKIIIQWSDTNFCGRGVYVSVASRTIIVQFRELLDFSPRYILAQRQHNTVNTNVQHTSIAKWPCMLPIVPTSFHHQSICGVPPFPNLCTQNR